MAFTAQTGKEVSAWLDSMGAITDAQTRDIAKMYAEVWDQTSSALQSALDELLAQAKDGTVSKATLSRSQRLQGALRHITDQLEQLAQDAGVRITGDLDSAVRASGRAQQRIIKASLPPEAHVASFDLVNKKAIDAIVNRATQQIESKLKKLPQAQAQALKRELIRGITVGSNPRQVASRIMKSTQRQFEGGAARASRIARTEMLDAMRAGAQSTEKLNKDVLKGWQWVTELDPKTCQACIGMHGRTFALDVPGPQGHPNCRCARVPTTRSWKDLGFNVKEPTSLLPDAEKWFKGLPPAEQQRIVGKANLADFNAGKFPMSDWAVKQDNPGWRPSYVPSR